MQVDYKISLEILSSFGFLPWVSYHTLQTQSGYLRPGNRFAFELALPLQLFLLQNRDKEILMRKSGIVNFPPLLSEALRGPGKPLFCCQHTFMWQRVGFGLAARGLK